jgi:hypothetical protein
MSSKAGNCAGGPSRKLSSHDTRRLNAEPLGSDRCDVVLLELARQEDRMDILKSFRPELRPDRDKKPEQV